MADFGDILKDIGDFGLFQWLLLFTLGFPNFSLPLMITSLIFIQFDPDRHCNTDWILSAGPNLTAEEQLNLTLPREEDGTFSKCQIFVPVEWDIDTIREYGLNQTTGCQNGWKYDKTLYEATIVTDFDLVCDKAVWLEVAQTMFMAGFLVGSLLFGPLADWFGRKRANQIPVVVMTIFTVTTGLCPNYYLYAACVFMMGVGGGGYKINCVVLATEWIGMSKRSLGACVSLICGAVGGLVCVGLVYFIRDWKLTQLITIAPMAVVFIYIWYIPESARWLIGRGRTEEAKKLISKVAAINKRTVPDSLLGKIEVKKVERGGISDLIRSPILRKYFFIMALAWFSASLSYYCLSFNVGRFGLSIFLTQGLFSAIEIPANLLCFWLLELLGRKVSITSANVIGGLCCILTLAVQGNAIAVTCLVTAARFFIIAGISICNVYMQELFPTSMRQTATGLGAVAAKIGGLLSPLVNILAMYHWAIPPVVYGSLLLVSGALIFLLPETRRRELPDSTYEAEGNRNMSSVNKASPQKMNSCPNELSTKL